jgi:cation:H+ antiporter
LVLLLLGSHTFIDAAKQLTDQMGISEWIVGIVIAAGGTSLPELVTALASVWQKRPEMALGNVLGSNTMNVFFVLGSAASVSPLGSARLSWTTSAGFLSLMLLGTLFLLTRSRLGRWEAGTLILAGIAWYALEFAT